MSKTEATLPIADIKKFERTLKRIPEQIREPSLLDLGEGLVGEAQPEAPVLSGHMAESHYVSDFEQDHVIVGVNTPYALAVHANHPTKSQWFSKAITRNFKRISRAAIRKAFKDRGAS